jgi:hypothetical protein
MAIEKLRTWFMRLARPAVTWQESTRTGGMVREVRLHTEMIGSNRPMETVMTPAQARRLAERLAVQADAVDGMNAHFGNGYAPATGTAKESDENGLAGILRDAAAVFLVGVHPDQRKDARDALRDFLVRAQATGYRIGFGDGQVTPKAFTLDELLAEDDQ